MHCPFLRYTEEYVCYVTDPEWTYEKGTVYVPRCFSDPDCEDEAGGRGAAGGRPAATTASTTGSSGSLLTLTFACTGSMNPYITCLDTGIGDSDFRPEDIRIGVVVGVDLSQDGCAISGSRVLHRVSSLRGSGTSLEVRTKGDANASDDGCWLPYSRIRYILVEVHKGANDSPENKETRESVQAAKSRLDRAERAMEAALAAYEAAENLHCEFRGDVCYWTTMGSSS